MVSRAIPKTGVSVMQKQQNSRKTSRTPLLAWMAGPLVVAVAIVGLAIGASNVSAFNPGSNGHPTSGSHTDLKGRAHDVTLTFQTNATLACYPGNEAAFFIFRLNYGVNGGP